MKSELKVLREQNALSAIDTIEHKLRDARMMVRKFPTSETKESILDLLTLASMRLESLKAKRGNDVSV